MTDIDLSAGPRVRRLRNAIVALGAALVTQAALAHAIVESSQPSPNAVVAPGEMHVSVRFSSRIDTARSRLALVAPNGRETPLTLGASAAPGVLTSTTRLTAGGRYTLHWQVLSLDGHVTRGDIPFRVGNSAAR